MENELKEKQWKEPNFRLNFLLSWSWFSLFWKVWKKKKMDFAGKKGNKKYEGGRETSELRSQQRSRLFSFEWVINLVRFEGCLECDFSRRRRFWRSHVIWSWEVTVSSLIPSKFHGAPDVFKRFQSPKSTAPTHYAKRKVKNQNLRNQGERLLMSKNDAYE